VKPRTSVEIGCAYGVSSLYICEALSTLPHPSRHTIIDPYQSAQWRGIGVKNLAAAGFRQMVDFREDFSEFVLPQLVREGVRLQFAFVDGWHTFDQVLVEFYYLNRMLDVGGVIAFDDANRRSVNSAIRHALTYPAYCVFGTERPQPARVSALGRARRQLASFPRLAALLRPDVLHRDWDLEIVGSCVAIRKVAEDVRSSGWHREF
jgi:predicted O-methyltransferase YrrM